MIQTRLRTTEGTPSAMPEASMPSSFTWVTMGKGRHSKPSSSGFECKRITCQNNVTELTCEHTHVSIIQESQGLGNVVQSENAVWTRPEPVKLIKHDGLIPLSVWYTWSLLVALHLLHGYKRCINLFIEPSARKCTSIFFKMSNNFLKVSGFQEWPFWIGFMEQNSKKEIT